VKIAVIGGGAAGIASAYLLDRHHDVVLFEANTRLGGHIATVGRNVACPKVDPQRPLEAGVLEFDRGSFHHLRALFRELGVRLMPATLQTSLHREDVGQSVYSPGLVQDAPKPAIWKARQLLRLLPAAQARGAFRRRAGQATPAALRTQCLQEWLPGEPMGTWMRALLTYAYATPYGETLDLPAELAVPTLAHFLQGKLDWVGVEGGVSRWIEAAQSGWQVEVRLHHPVRRVMRPQDGVLVDGERFDAVVLATSPGQLPRLLADADEDEQRRLGAWQDHAIETVVHTDQSLYRGLDVPYPTAFDLFTDGACGAYNAFLNPLCGYGADDPEWYAMALYLDERIDPSKVVHRERLVAPRYALASFRHREEVLASQGHRSTYVAGAWLGNGLHEGAIGSAFDISRRLGGHVPSPVAAPPRKSLEPV